MNEVTKKYDCNLNVVIKPLAFEHLEDELDLQIIKEYEQEKQAGTLELLSFEEMTKSL